jgi:uridine monophosphate synthetase
MTFFSQLESRAGQVDSLLCVGLDPHPQDLRVLAGQAQITPRHLRDFCLRLIDATADTAAAYKPNAAFFEAFGYAGVQVLQEVIAAVPKGIPVILDAKRGDIASTAQAYAEAVFQTMGAHAVTVNPYLGYDAVRPFLANPGKGVFLLCKTSNPGAADLQDLLTSPIASSPWQGWLTLYEQVALLAQKWNQNDNLGLVVGATYPRELRKVRYLAPDLWILAPEWELKAETCRQLCRPAFAVMVWACLYPYRAVYLRRRNRVKRPMICETRSPGCVIWFWVR